MKPPIIVSEGGDISIYKSVADAESDMESPDVWENRYVAYDSEGNLLQISATGPKPSVNSIVVDIWPVRIYESESNTNHAEDLRRTLIAALTRLGESESELASLSLNALMLKSISRLGFTQ